jgi:site-specific DNA-methyltransferase (adenine-specific)
MRNTKNSISVLGDALTVLKRLPDHSFDACIADPPYNMSKKKGLSWAFSNHVTMQESWDQFSKEDYFRFSYQWLSEICRVVKPNGNIFVFGTYHNIYSLGFILQQLDRKILNSIVWIKPNAQPNITCRMLTESTEQLIWACNNSKKLASKWTFQYKEAKKFNNGKQLRNYWSIPITAKSERVAAHPSQKPQVLLERLVEIATKKGDWVLDPFAGVGTTGVAAVAKGRNTFLIEKKMGYFNAQKLRFDAMGAGSKIEFLKEPPARQKSEDRKTAPGECFVASFLAMTAHSTHV